MLAALAASRAEEERNARQTFALHKFVESNPNTCGMLWERSGKHTATLGLHDLIKIEDDDDEIYAIYFDEDEKQIRVSLATPPQAQRTARELLHAVHFAALARDNAKHPPYGCVEEADKEKWFIEQEHLVAVENFLADMITDAFVRASKSEMVQDTTSYPGLVQLEQTVTKALTKPFSPAPTQEDIALHCKHIRSVAELGLAQPAAPLTRTTIDFITQNCAAILGGKLSLEGEKYNPQDGTSEMYPVLSPEAHKMCEWGFYVGLVELLRWRLIRAAIDGVLLREIQTAARNSTKRLIKMSKITTLPNRSTDLVTYGLLTPSCQGFFANEAHANLMLAALHAVANVDINCGDDPAENDQHPTKKLLAPSCWKMLVFFEVVLGEMERVLYGSA